MSSYEEATRAAAVLRRRARLDGAPDVAVVLGSGWGRFAATLEPAVTIACAEMPGWPVPTAEGHDGRLVIGRPAGGRARLVAALAGRAHLYEGHDAGRVAFPVRVLGLLGVKTLILTNAAGGIRTSLAPGEVMVIDDHLNLMGDSPLKGPAGGRFGPRFPDMTAVYSPRLRARADESAAAVGLSLPHGVYAGLPGPSYETPAEIRGLRTMGADAVGMSTVPEALAARQMGVEVLGLSCISNMAAGVRAGPLSHEDVLATAGRLGDRLVVLLEAIIGRL